MYIAEYVGKTFRSTYPKAPEKPDIPDDVRSLSATFVVCYEQAFAAESSRLSEIAGGGYRKALEFLIKDYCTKERPESATEIAAMFLGSCIEKFIDASDLKDCAKRAAWLGNDELHYVRRWEGEDLATLKQLLELTIFWVSSKLKTKKILERMPPGGGAN